MSNLSPAPQSNSDSEPGIAHVDKNDIIELGKVPAGKLDEPYGF
jgi:hypothetical protein